MVILINCFLILGASQDWHKEKPQKSRTKTERSTTKMLHFYFHHTSHSPSAFPHTNLTFSWCHSATASSVTWLAVGCSNPYSGVCRRYICYAWNIGLVLPCIPVIPTLESIAGRFRSWNAYELHHPCTVWKTVFHSLPAFCKRAGKRNKQWINEPLLDI